MPSDPGAFRRFAALYTATTRIIILFCKAIKEGFNCTVAKVTRAVPIVSSRWSPFYIINGQPIISICPLEGGSQPSVYIYACAGGAADVGGVARIHIVRELFNA
jgi:hypothetical protein